MSDKKNLDGIELDDSMLDGIAGGSISDSKKKQLKNLVYNYLSKGRTLNDVLNQSIIQDDEQRQYVRQIWGQLHH